MTTLNQAVDYPEEINSSSFKYDEIKSVFEDFINDEQNKYFVKNQKDDLHHEIYNRDYYIVGRYKAKIWLEDQVFNVIDIIKKYENFNFGQVTTDLSEPEKVVNMYTYIVGEEIVNNFINKED